MKKFNAFVNVINRLARAAELKPPYSDLELAGIIRLFENSFELAWKTLREVLLIHGVSTAASGSPREILKAGYQYHFIDDAELWLDMLKRRNLTAHLYDETSANELVTLIFDRYLAALTDLRAELERRLIDCNESPAQPYKRRQNL